MHGGILATHIPDSDLVHVLGFGETLTSRFISDVDQEVLPYCKACQCAVSWIIEGLVRCGMASLT